MTSLKQIFFRLCTIGIYIYALWIVHLAWESRSRIPADIIAIYLIFHLVLNILSALADAWNHRQ
jgi:hypothetical protein